MNSPSKSWADVYAVQTARIAELERENAALREKAERYRLVTLRQDAELADWRGLAIWGGTPEVIHEFIRGQQNRIHHCQDLETELAALRQDKEILDWLDANVDAIMLKLQPNSLRLDVREMVRQARKEGEL